MSCTEAEGGREGGGGGRRREGAKERERLLMRKEPKSNQLNLLNEISGAVEKQRLAGGGSSVWPSLQLKLTSDQTPP